MSYRRNSSFKYGMFLIWPTYIYCFAASNRLWQEMLFQCFMLVKPFEEGKLIIVKQLVFFSCFLHRGKQHKGSYVECFCFPKGI